jgi:two-component system nitrate/nitrite response regulator NarL
MSDVIRLLLVDDHTLLRTVLSSTLRIDPQLEVVAEAGSGESGVRLAQQHRPDVVLLDVEMPGQSVTVTVRQLTQAVPRARIIILSMPDDCLLKQELTSLGVQAYLHDSATIDTLMSAIRRVAGSEPGPTISYSRRPTTMTPTEGPDSDNGGSGLLSARELEVLVRVATAMSNRQIAAALGITESTVKRHLRNIFGKLNAVSRLDAVNKAVQGALIGPRAEHRAPQL